jgi:hypothetical protein
VLPAKFSLRNVDDVEAVASRALTVQCKAMGARLDPWAYEDALGYLLEQAVRFAHAYDPDRTSVSFATNLYVILRLRTIDHLRQTLGRSKWQFSSHEYVRERPLALSFDAQRDFGDPLVDTLAGFDGDSASSGGPACGGIIAGGGGGAALDRAIVRYAAARVTSRRTQRKRANRR